MAADGSRCPLRPRTGMESVGADRYVAYHENMRSADGKQLVHQAFRFELDPSRAQRVLLAKSVGTSRYVYNWGLAESQRVYELTGRRPPISELKAQLVTLKKTEAPWLYEVSAHIGQQALVDLDRAYNRIFEGLKGKGPKSGFPRFKHTANATPHVCTTWRSRYVISACRTSARFG